MLTFNKGERGRALFLKALWISSIIALDNASCSWGQYILVQLLICPDYRYIVHFKSDKPPLVCCVIAMVILC